MTPTENSEGLAAASDEKFCTKGSNFCLKRSASIASFTLANALVGTLLTIEKKRLSEYCNEQLLKPMAASF